jgi:hypothetical protein
MLPRSAVLTEKATPIHGSQERIAFQAIITR